MSPGAFEKMTSEKKSEDPLDAVLPKKRPPPVTPRGVSFLLKQDNRRRATFTKYLNKHYKRTAVELDRAMRRRNPPLTVIESMAIQMLLRAARKGPDTVTQNLLFFLSYAPGSRAAVAKKDEEARLAANPEAPPEPVLLPTADEFEEAPDEAEDDEDESDDESDEDDDGSDDDDDTSP